MGSNEAGAGLGAASDLLAAFAQAFNQRDRLLRLRFAPRARQWESVLLPELVRGREALHGCYRFTLQCLSSDTHAAVETLIGEPIELGIQTAAGKPRPITGLVTAARSAGSDGGFARFELVIEPALAVLERHRLARVFQGKTVPQIVRALLEEQRQANASIGGALAIDDRLRREYPVRSYCAAYRESARAFIERLLAEEGIGWGFRFDGAEGSEIPTHTLVLFDDAQEALGIDCGGIRFHDPRMTESADGHTEWQALRTFDASRASLASVDYKQARAVRGEESRRGAASDAALAASLEDYDPQSAYYGADIADMSRYAGLRSDAAEARVERYAGAGSVRTLAAGARYVLDDHPVHAGRPAEERRFIVTALELEAESNLPKPLAQVAAGGMRAAPRPGYRNRFEAVRAGTPVLPAFAATEHARPRARGIQIATVVGPADAEIYTDEAGRIRIQYPWQREQDHPDGTAHMDERASTWVRVMMPAAGAAFGHQFIPRVGQSVIVDFIESDIDRPIVTGVVYDGAHAPPRFAGRGELPGNQALSGVRSKELQGGRANHLLFDDTNGAIRAQVSSDHQASEVNLGFLTSARESGKANPRGEGFEARTDAAAAIRGARGVLVSAEGQAGGRGPQLERARLLAEIRAAIDLLAAQGDYAGAHNALANDAKAAGELKQKLDAWERGTNVDSAGGAAGSPGGAATIALSAPEGLALASGASMLHGANGNLDAIAGMHAQIAAGQNVAVTAGKSISLSAQGDGLRAIAHRGALLLQSQAGETEVNAAKHLTLTSTEGEIRILASKTVTLMTEGGAYLRLKGGEVEIGAPGGFTVKAARHSSQGAASAKPDLPKFDSSDTARRFKLEFDAGTALATVAAGRAYTVLMDDGTEKKGTADDEGHTEITESEAARIATIEIEGNEER